MSHQPLPLVEQLKNLECLQEIDLKIDSLTKDKNALPSHLKSIDESLQKIKAAVTDQHTQAHELEKIARQTQAALDLNRDRLSRASGKLEAVQNGQEFQAANKEIEQLKKLNATLEEQGKKSETELDGLRKVIAKAEEEMSQIQTQRDSQAAVMRGQESQLTSDIDALLSERTQYTSQVDRQILVKYDRIRVARGGLGIVPTLGGRCKGCNMMVPPQLFNEVQRGSALHCCPSCHRLLFVPNSNHATPQGVAG